MEVRSINKIVKSVQSKLMKLYCFQPQSYPFGVCLRIFDLEHDVQYKHALDFLENLKPRKKRV